NPQKSLRKYHSKIREDQQKINFDSPRTKTAVLLLKLTQDQYTLKDFFQFQKLSEYNSLALKTKQIQKYQIDDPYKYYYQHLQLVHTNLKRIIQERKRLIQQNNYQFRKTAEGCSRKILNKSNREKSQYLDHLNIDYQIQKVNSQHEKEVNIHGFQIQNEIRQEFLLRKQNQSIEQKQQRVEQTIKKQLDEKLKNVKIINQKHRAKKQQIKISHQQNLQKDMQKIKEMYLKQNQIYNKVKESKSKVLSFTRSANSAKTFREKVDEKIILKSEQLRQQLDQRDNQVYFLMKEHWSQRVRNQQLFNS
ncbi:hypothetical protein IMG5_192470, partial [Ichthyophthirius multifiliis]